MVPYLTENAINVEQFDGRCWQFPKNLKIQRFIIFLWSLLGLVLYFSIILTSATSDSVSSITIFLIKILSSGNILPSWFTRTQSSLDKVPSSNNSLLSNSNSTFDSLSVSAYSCSQFRHLVAHFFHPNMFLQQCHG